MTCNDLILKSSFSPVSRGLGHRYVFRQTRFLSNYELRSVASISNLCRPLLWRLENPFVQMLRVLSRHGLRSIDLPRKLTLKVFYSSKAYPEPLRRIRYYDEENDRRLVFLTNNMQLPAVTIAELYKSRWQIELFFKWIKQHLRIKSFFGTSANAVKSQIWIAISVYLLVAILKKELGIDRTLYEILQVLSLTQFEKTPINQVFENKNYNTETTPSHNQLTLFDL